MKMHIHYIKYTLAILSTAFAVSCEEDTESDNRPYLEISAEKIPGHGQYQVKVQSGYEVSVTAAAPVSLSELKITKKINLELDSSYGDDGVLDVPVSSDEYSFSYMPTVEEVDQLVGFTFQAKDANGRVYESDLTVIVTLSPRDNLTRRRWNWKSILHVNNEDEPNVESIKDCEKDNAWLYEENGTLTLDYGSNTGSAGCDFDNWTVYTDWHLTEDEKFFIVKRYGIFSPDVIETDSFRVKVLTVERLELEIDYDLSDLGLRDKETFLYKFAAAPR